MRLREIKSDHFNLADVAKIASTLEFKIKVDKALQITENFVKQCQKPAVSFGGGKDSMAVLILAQMIDPKIAVICANPPNPLTGRAEHIKNTESVCGVDIIKCDYLWDVDSVLCGKEKYPAKKKQMVLRSTQNRYGIDGVIWGCRNSESRGRTINFAKNGYIYRSGAVLICQPIAKWTAEDVLALAVVSGYPINPVYEKMDGYYNLDDLHDGTWWPHDTYGQKGAWLKKYYPEHYEKYLKAQKIGANDQPILW